MNIGSASYTSTLQRQYSILQDAQAKIQSQIATGKTFVQASENPRAALTTQRISLNRLDIQADADRRDLGTRLNDGALLNAQQATSVLEEASVNIELAYEYESDDPENAGFGDRIDSYIEQAAAFLNYELDGRFLFGGNETAQKPFDVAYDANGKISGVTYNGSDQPLEFEVGLGVRMDPTADASTNQSWADWTNNLILARDEFENGDPTASKAALDQSNVASQDTFASTTDLIGKSLRLQTLNEWATQADTTLANQEASLQEADLNEVILQFNDLQRSYEASLQSGRLLLSLSLVDFL